MSRIEELQLTENLAHGPKTSKTSKFHKSLGLVAALRYRVLGAKLCCSNPSRPQLKQRLEAISPRTLCHSPPELCHHLNTSIAMSDEPRKRSRFDQTEPEPSRKSRFDRRSRSPARKESDSHRSRSPVARSIESPGSADKKDAAAAAAAAAAKINASLNAKKGVQHVDVPPIRSVCLQKITSTKPYI